MNVRKLGLDDAAAPTKGLDALYDTLNKEGAASIETDKMCDALRSLQLEEAGVAGRRERSLAHAANVREVAEQYREAAKVTEKVQEEKQALENLRRVTSQGSPAIVLGMPCMRGMVGCGARRAMPAVLHVCAMMLHAATCTDAAYCMQCHVCTPLEPMRHAPAQAI